MKWTKIITQSLAPSKAKNSRKGTIESSAQLGRTSTPSQLSQLICGGTLVDEAGEAECELSQILLHLRGMIDGNLAELINLSNEADDSRISLYGPFLGRSLLEVGITALVGRMDPTRLLIVKRTQEHGTYNTQKPWNSAIRWQGDVLDKKVGDLWTPDRQYRDMTKALFGDYYAELYWSTALKRLSDATAEGGEWLANIVSQKVEQFISTRREQLSSLFSESSKGVHSEFVIPPGSRYDKVTVVNLVSKIIQLLSELGLLANFLPHVPYRFSDKDAITLFNEMENVEVIL